VSDREFVQWLRSQHMLAAADRIEALNRRISDLHCLLRETVPHIENSRLRGVDPTCTLLARVTKAVEDQKP
jgi:hypothetical protein